MGESKLDLLQGTLDVMVLQTLHTMGPLHGYGVARRIEQVSADQVLLCRLSRNQRSTCTSAGDTATDIAMPDAAIHQLSADVVKGDCQVARMSLAA